MIATTKQQLSFDQFVKDCPDEGLYELVNGEIVEMKSTRNHDDVAEFVDRRLYQEVERLGLNYVVKRTIPIKTQTKDGIEQARRPDVSVIDRMVWRSDRFNYNALDDPILLAIEVVSTNWEDDYIDKLDEYQRWGISEYWIVDYLAIGAREFLGNPKVATVFVFLLDAEGKYQRTQFRGNEQVRSRIFPELTLTAEQIFNA